MFLYIKESFENGISDTHQIYWQSYEIAHQISSYGYNVGIGNAEYNKDQFPHNYDLIFDIHPVDGKHVMIIAKLIASRLHILQVVILLLL